MPDFPLWKLKREIDRLGRQLRNSLPAAFEYVMLTPYVDRVLSKRQKITVGTQPWNNVAAIYLIFPRDGIKASHLDTLRQLSEVGAATLIVSNAPLTDAMRETLRPHCFEILERENVGYDFGGYRDGVLRIADRLASLEHLFICNDSAWFVETPESWFRTALDLKVDFAGATSNFGIQRVQPKKFRDIDYKYSSSHRNFHYASSALCIGRNVLSDPDFLAFWKKLRLTNAKNKVVRRGEIGLTQLILKRGHCHSATCPSEGLDRELALLSTARIEQIADRMIVPDDESMLTIKHEVLRRYRNNDADRSELEALILTAVARQAMTYALPEYTMKERRLQVLKKSPLWLHSESSDISLKIIEDIDYPQMGIVRDEALELQKRL